MNSVLLDLGIFQIKWYSIFMLLAILSATFIITKETKKKGLSEDNLINLIFYGVIFGVLGARIYYVLFNLDYYLKSPVEIFMIWHGGLAIHGSIIGGLLFLLFYTKKKSLNLFLLLDIIVVGLILGQAIGRWGNFFNGEAYGRIISLDYLHNLHLPNFIIEGMYIENHYREPTFLYESIASLLGFFFLIFLRQRKSLKLTILTGTYLIWYGIERFIVEAFRSDSLMLGSFKIAQCVSLISVILGLILLIKRKNKGLYHKERF